MTYEAPKPLSAEERELARKVCHEDLARLEALEDAMADILRDGTVLMAEDHMKEPE